MSRPPVSTTSDSRETSADPSDDVSARRLSDAELEALRNRDPRAVRRHIYENRDYLRSVLRRYTQDDETARDLLQETFFQALRSLPSFRGEAKLTTWLYSIAKNVALARYRKDKRRSPMEEETLTHVASQESLPGVSSGHVDWNPASDAIRNEESALVHEALEELSENYRQVIELRDLKELSTKEVADCLGLTRVNVRVRLHRARQKLEEQLDSRLKRDERTLGNRS